jgi:hypothetical protein
VIDFERQLFAIVVASSPKFILCRNSFAQCSLRTEAPLLSVIVRTLSASVC